MTKAGSFLTLLGMVSVTDKSALRLINVNNYLKQKEMGLQEVRGKALYSL